MSNLNMHKARKVKNDEFYTYLTDIEKELIHYRDYFKGKTILLPCDDINLINGKEGDSPEDKASQFWVFFHKQFKVLGITKLIASHFKEGEKTYYITYDGNGDDNDISIYDKYKLNGDGDFRSKEIKELFQISDLIITNPPFSLFREFVDQIMEYDKKFIIIGNMGSIIYKNIFPLIKNEKIWMGHSFIKQFITNKNEIKKMGNVCWFTNLKTSKWEEEIISYKKYDKDYYPKYDNYDAININKVVEIPLDYMGKMGVPVSFLFKYNPKQFEIIDAINRYSVINGPTTETRGKFLSQVNGEKLYSRIIIKRRKI